jgi:hypothetical protein
MWTPGLDAARLGGRQAEGDAPVGTSTMSTTEHITRTGEKVGTATPPPNASTEEEAMRPVSRLATSKRGPRPHLDPSRGKYRCWFACTVSAEKPEREILT